MLNQNEAHDDQFGQDLPQRDVAADRSIADRQVADREVPLPGASADGPSLALHAWLDGETGEAEARRADAKQVDLWNRIGAETAARRRMTTPAYVMANVMAALPEASTDARVETQAMLATSVAASAMTEAPGGLSLPIVAMIGAGLFAAGLLVGKMI